MSDPRISVILPVYNQADHIGPVIDGYRTALESANLSFELLPIVNGKRKDSSAEICSALADAHPSIRTFVIDEGGWGRAVRHGLAQARGEILCFTNTARTTADDLLLLLLYGVTHPDVVVEGEPPDSREPAPARGVAALQPRVPRAFDLSAWDVNGTPKVFPRRFEPLPA